MSSEGPKSTDINWEQAQQESIILNVLSAPTPADISMECTNVFDCSCFDSYNMSFGKLLKHSWCKNEA